MENNFRELTKAEEQVMQVIWKIGKGFANEIMSNFSEPKHAYNDVVYDPIANDKICVQIRNLMEDNIDIEIFRVRFICMMFWKRKSDRF